MQLIHLAPSHPCPALEDWRKKLDKQTLVVGLHRQIDEWLQQAQEPLPNATDPWQGARGALRDALELKGDDRAQLERWFQAIDWLEQVPADFAPRLRRFVQIRRGRQLAARLGLRWVEPTDLGDAPPPEAICTAAPDPELLPALARRWKVDCVQFWIERPGFFTADPGRVPQARLLLQLNSRCAQELARLQNLEIDPEALEQLHGAGIPAEIGWLQHPDWPRSQVIPKLPGGSAVWAVVAGPQTQLISLKSQRMWRRPGFLAEAFQHLAREGLSIDLLATSQTSVALTLDPGQRISPEQSQNLGQALQCEVEIFSECACIHLVGTKIRQMLPQLGPALELFDEHPIHLVSQSSSDVSLSLVVSEEQVTRLHRSLHALLFGGDQESDILGPTFQQLDARVQRTTPAASARWWQAKRERLLQLAENGPSYVYDSETILQRSLEVQQIGCIDEAFYALKANPFQPILECLSQQGFGLECVSPGELERAATTGAARLFTPNFVHPEEYALAFGQPCRVTLDNADALRRWPDVFRGQSVLLRLDSGTGTGHHKHVRTAGDSSKFGISAEQLPELKKLLEENRVTVLGLHCHAGSGITDAEHWVRTAQFLSAAAQEYFPSARILNLGGGLGIPDRPGKQRLDFGKLRQSLEAFLALNPGRKLWLEPGRYLVAEAGVIVTRVTQVKQKGERRYIGIDVGFNTLLRPALYGAYHPIYNLSRLEQPAVWKVDVVGPICETGDVLGHDRWMPATEPGDVLLIDNCGAYGASMASHYNLRPPAREIWLD